MRSRITIWLWVAGGAVVLLCACGLVLFLRARLRRPHPVSVTVNATNAQALLQEADYLAYLGNWERARPYFARAGEIFAKRGDRRDEIYCKISCMEADVEHGSYTAASRYLGRELQDPVVQKHPRLKLRCLTVKGIVDLNTNTAAAEYDWTQAAGLARQLHDVTWEDRSTGWLGIVDFVNGNSGRAIRRVLEAIAEARWHGDVSGEAGFLTYLGDGLVAINRPSQALTCLNTALKLERSDPDTPIPYRTDIAKVDALETLRRYAEARTLLARTLMEARQTQTLGAQAELLREAGQLARETGDIRGAEAAYEQAATVARQARLPRLLAESEFQLTDLYREQGDLAKAQTCVSQGIEAVREVAAAYELPHYLAVEAELKAAAHQYRQADQLFSRAEDLVEGMLMDAPNSMVETSLLNAMSDIYVEHFRLAALSLKDIDEAFEIVEQARGRALADDLHSHKKWTEKGSAMVNPGEADIDDLQRQLRQPHTSDERAELLDKLDVAEAILANTQYEHVQIKKLVPTRPVTLNVFEHSLQPDETVLEFVLANPSSFRLAITRRTTTLDALPARSQIETAIHQYLADVEARKPPGTPAKQLYRWLLAGSVENDAAQRLVIVPDGELNDLPFDALVDPNGHYVIESHVVSVAPSATVLYILRADRASPSMRTFLGVGYAKGPTLASAAAAPLSERIERTVRGIFDVDNPTLSPLPYSREEVRSAAQLMGPGSTVLLGSKATKENVETEPLGDFRILHFAVHGIANKDNPDRSALVFCEGASPGDDGLLQVRDIRKLSLNADLVTLSACNTGVGKIEGEEGVDSLTGAFLMAGARSVLSSLWSVNDRYTATLMDKFYRNLAQGVDESTALNRAKLEILRQYGAGTAPYFWAGFVLIGEGNAKIMRGDDADPTHQK
ncbi:MAG: CHAT domain-containing protein [Terriglobia bacterium]